MVSNRKTHRPLFWLCLAFMAGIVVDATLHPTFWGEFAGVACGVVGALLARRWRFGMVLILLATMSAGALCAKSAVALPPDHIVFAQKRWRGAEVAVKGVVVSDVDERSLGRGQRVTFTLAMAELCRDAVCRPASGKVLVNMFVTPALEYGDEVVLRGKLHRPFEFSTQGHSSYREYLSRRRILLALTVKKANVPVVTGHGKGNALVGLSIRCRQALENVYSRYLPPPEAGLMNAFMLGDRSNIPPHVLVLFKKTGTAHVIAISGLNIAMLAFMIFLALSILPIRRVARTGWTVTLIAVYSFLVGGGSPVVRSAIMSGIFLLSFIIEREQDKVNTLSAAALVILAVDPMQLFDVGFQLSFGCVLALLLWTPFFLGFCETTGLRSRPVCWFFIESLAVSLAAWLGSVGMVAYYFGMVTPVGLLANLPVVPLTALVTALGAAILVVASVVPLFAVCVAACLKVALNLMVLSLWMCSLVPGGAGRVGEVSAIAVGIYYVLLLSSYFLVRRLACRILSARDMWNAGI